MSDEKLESILGGVPHDRRTFIKRVVAGTAFAVPVVASFTMNPVSAGGATTANQSNVLRRFCSTTANQTQTPLRNLLYRILCR